MLPLFRSLILGALVGLAAGQSLHAQGTESAKVEWDFSHDPCGNPFMESQAWFLTEGTVVGVKGGSTIFVSLADGHQLVRVHLAGIAPQHRGPAYDLAETHVREMALNKPVEVLLNSDGWVGSEKKPQEAIGVVHLAEGAPTDIGRDLLAGGLARSKEPKPFTMSNYTFCEYRRAESEAKSKKLGVWR